MKYNLFALFLVIAIACEPGHPKTTTYNVLVTYNDLSTDTIRMQYITSKGSLYSPRINEKGCASLAYQTFACDVRSISVINKSVTAN